MELAPVSFNPDVAAAGVAPMAGNPTGSATRGRHINAGNPDVASAVPAVVSAAPDPVAVRVWRRWNHFAARRRRSDANGNLRLSNACRKKKAAGDGEEEFLHLLFFSFVLLRIEPEAKRWSCGGARA